LLERTMQAEKSLAAEDLGASRHPGDVQLADLGFGWSVAVPLFARADRVGILVAGGRHRAPPSEDERLLVEQAAAHLAPALANARIHQRLVELHARLVRLDDAKDTLSSLVVHDLRGPLSVAIANVGFLHDLAVESANTDDIAALGDAKDALEGVADTIHHLLDIAHLEEARMPCDPRPVDPGVLAEELIRGYARIAQRKGVRLSLRSAAKVFPIDDGLITRMLRNLIGNALRHTPAGGEVAVRIRGVEDRLEISVADDGPGVPESQRSALFSKFARLADSPKNLGYGLGLHFVKLAAEAHGGSVRFESAPGGGSIFFVELPRRQPG
jgi:signal transduction histidine kinase